jgi:hypothetical protein
MKSQKLWKNVVVALGILVTATAAHAANRVVQPGQEFAGKSYSELANEWTQWLITEPIATNPAFDPDGRYCDLNQHGKVWFLASTFEGVAARTCTIPEGKALFLSLGGVFVSFAPEFPDPSSSCAGLGTVLDQVRCDVNGGPPTAPGTSFAVTLDGQPIGDLFAFRAQSPQGGFTLRIPSSSFLTDLGLAPGKRQPAVADGYFLFLKPLKPGEHVLRLRMVKPDLSVTGVDYTLNIEGDESSL